MKYATDRITYHTICGSNPPMKSTEINTVQSSCAFHPKSYIQWNFGIIFVIGKKYNEFLRIKEQETCLTLQEHNDDDEF